MTFADWLTAVAADLNMSSGDLAAWITFIVLVIVWFIWG